MKMHIDIPPSHPLYSKIFADLQTFRGLNIVDSCIEADFTIRLLGWPTLIDSRRLIIVGDFYQPQTVPACAVCINISDGKVQMPGGQNIHWKHYFHEWLVPVV